MRVVAKEMIYIYNMRIREGQKFTLKDPKHFSKRSMEKAENVKAEPEEDVSAKGKKGKVKKHAAEVFAAPDEDQDAEEVI